MSSDAKQTRPKRPPIGSITPPDYAKFGGGEEPNGDTVEQLERETSKPLHGITVPQFNREPVEQSDSVTVKASQRESVPLSDSETVEKQEKTSFYLSAALLEKLDDLAHDYRKANGFRVNRNDIVRHLVEGCSLESLSGLRPLERQKGKQL